MASKLLRMATGTWETSTWGRRIRRVRTIARMGRVLRVLGRRIFGLGMGNSSIMIITLEESMTKIRSMGGGRPLSRTETSFAAST